MMDFRNHIIQTYRLAVAEGMDPDSTIYKVPDSIRNEVKRRMAVLASKKDASNTVSTKTTIDDGSTSSDEEESPLQRRAKTQLSSPSSKWDSQAHCFYVQEASNNKLALLVMASNLKNKDGRVMADFEQPPYDGAHIKTIKKPTKKELSVEIERRAALIKATNSKYRMPAPKNWNLPVQLQWLADNPITDQREIDWIAKEEGKYYCDCMQALKEKLELLSTKSTNWSDIRVWLRLYEAASQDNAKAAHLREMTAKNRVQLDARNNEKAHLPIQSSGS